MKNTRFTESQIIKALKENEQGRKVEDICREMVHTQGHLLQLAKEIFRYGRQSVERTQRAQGRKQAVKANVC